MPRTPRTTIPVLLTALLVAILSGCGGGDDNGSGDDSSTLPASSSPLPKAKASTINNKSCQGIVGSGAVEDIAKVFDKYKNNSTPFTTADAKAMHDALDRLAKAGDNAAPSIREDMVKLVADAGSLIDSRAKLEGVGHVASVATVQKEINTLCR